MRYLADFEPGQLFTAGPVEVTQEEVISFASRYDPQPFHTDPVAAEDSFFKGLASSGWMTAALTMRLFAESGLGIAGGLIGRDVELHWPRPTYPGDMLRAETEVLEVIPSRSRPDRGMIRVKVTTLNQRDEVAQTMLCRMLVPARPSQG